MIIYHLALIKGTRNSYWKMADVSCFCFCAELCFLPFPPFRKQSRGKKQTQPAPMARLPPKTPCWEKSCCPSKHLSRIYLFDAWKKYVHIFSWMVGIAGDDSSWYNLQTITFNKTNPSTVLTKTKLQMGHLNSIFLLVVFFFRGSKCLKTSDLTGSSHASPTTIEPQGPPTTFSSRQVSGELKSWSDTCQAAGVCWKVVSHSSACLEDMFLKMLFLRKNPLFEVGGFEKKQLNGIRKMKKTYSHAKLMDLRSHAFHYHPIIKSECNLNTSLCLRATSHARHSPKTLTKVSMSDSKQTYQGWFQGLRIMGPPYGKLPILLPYL